MMRFQCNNITAITYSCELNEITPLVFVIFTPCVHSIHFHSSYTKLKLTSVIFIFMYSYFFGTVKYCELNKTHYKPFALPVKQSRPSTNRWQNIHVIKTYKWWQLYTPMRFMHCLFTGTWSSCIILVPYRFTRLSTLRPESLVSCQ